MKNRAKSLIYAAIIGLIIVAIFLGFLSSLANPVSWILIGVLILIPFVYKKAGISTQIKWKDEYSVGIKSLDEDHKKLIGLLNQFTTAYDYAMSEEYESEALQDLINYTKYHFHREEKLMEDNGYPDLAAHKKQHQAMIKQVNVFVSLYDQQGHDALEQVSDFLANWLINHINGTDKKYSEHLKTRSVN
jgi:hemerythrin